MSGSLFFPSIYPVQEDLTLVDDTTTVFQSSFGVGLTQRVTRIGPRWRIRVVYELLGEQLRNNMIGFLSALRGKAYSFMYSPRHATLRGSFPASELLSNVAFDVTTGWTSSNAEMVLYPDSNRLRLIRNGVTGNRYAYAAQLTGLTSGAAYLFRAANLKGKGSAYWDLRAGSSAGASTYLLSSTYQSNGYGHVANTIAATTAYASIYDYSSGRSIGDYQSYDGVSFSRCIRVNGAAQSGSALNVKNLPVSTNGLLKVGDVVSVFTERWELKRVTADLVSDSSGLGYLQFEPSLTAPPSDSAPIAVHAPTGRFIMASDPTFVTGPGKYTDIEIEMVEVIE